MNLAAKLIDNLAAKLFNVWRQSSPIMTTG
jgi:hypothetical protein